MNTKVLAIAITIVSVVISLLCWALVVSVQEADYVMVGLVIVGIGSIGLVGSIIISSEIRDPISEWFDALTRRSIVRRPPIDGSSTIEWPEYEGKEKDLVWEFPYKKIIFGTKLIVRQNEVVAFIKNRKVYDLFFSGEYVITHSSLPKLSEDLPKIMNRQFVDVTICYCSTLEVANTFPEMKKMIKTYEYATCVTADMQYKFKVVDPILFLGTIASRNKFTTHRVSNFLRKIPDDEFRAQKLDSNEHASGPAASSAIAFSADWKQLVVDKFRSIGIEVLEVNFKSRRRSYWNRSGDSNDGPSSPEYF